MDVDMIEEAERAGVVSIGLYATGRSAWRISMSRHRMSITSDAQATGPTAGKAFRLALDRFKADFPAAGLKRDGVI